MVAPSIEHTNRAFVTRRQRKHGKGRKEQAEIVGVEENARRRHPAPVLIRPLHLLKLRDHIGIVAIQPTSGQVKIGEHLHESKHQRACERRAQHGPENVYAATAGKQGDGCVHDQGNAPVERQGPNDALGAERRRKRHLEHHGDSHDRHQPNHAKRLLGCSQAPSAREAGASVHRQHGKEKQHGEHLPNAHQKAQAGIGGAAVFPQNESQGKQHRQRCQDPFVAARAEVGQQQRGERSHVGHRQDRPDDRPRRARRQGEIRHQQQRDAGKQQNAPPKQGPHNLIFIHNAQRAPRSCRSFGYN